jgi:hypothetical protein
MAQLPAAVPATAEECQAAIAAAQPTVLALQVRLQGWRHSRVQGILKRLGGATPGRSATSTLRPCPTQHLLEAAELSLADGLLDRCRDVAWSLHRCGGGVRACGPPPHTRSPTAPPLAPPRCPPPRFGIRLVDSLMERAASSAPADEGGWAAPGWVLDVRSVTEAQVGSPAGGAANWARGGLCS